MLISYPEGRWSCSIEREKIAVEPDRGTRGSQHHDFGDPTEKWTDGRLTFPEPLLDVLDELEHDPMGLFVRELLRVSRLGLLRRVRGDEHSPVFLRRNGKGAKVSLVLAREAEVGRGNEPWCRPGQPGKACHWTCLPSSS